MKTARANQVALLPLTSKNTIILEDLEFGFENWELREITKRWNNGESLEAIAKDLVRVPDEVFLALFHQARLGNITRPFAFRVQD